MLEVEATGEPPDLVAFKRRARQVGLEIKRKYGLCEVANRTLSSAGLGPGVGQATKVAVQVLLPGEFMVSIDNIEEYAGKTPEEQTALMKEWLLSHQSEMKARLSGISLTEGLTVCDINHAPKFAPTPERFVEPPGFWGGFTSRDGRVKHLFRSRYGRADWQYPLCGAGYVRPEETSRRDEERYCARCVQRATPDQV